MNSPVPQTCTCTCGGPVSRPHFLKTTVNGIAAAAGSPSLPLLNSPAAPTPSSPAAALVTSLYKSLREEQRQSICFPFDHPLRSKVDNNWQITKKSIAEAFDKEQQAMIREIFRNLHNPEYADRVIHQVEHDAGTKGFGA